MCWNKLILTVDWIDLNDWCFFRLVEGHFIWKRRYHQQLHWLRLCTRVCFRFDVVDEELVPPISIDHEVEVIHHSHSLGFLSLHVREGEFVHPYDIYIQNYIDSFQGGVSTKGEHLIASRGKQLLYVSVGQQSDVVHALPWNFVFILCNVKKADYSSQCR